MAVVYRPSLRFNVTYCATHPDALFVRCPHHYKKDTASTFQPYCWNIEINFNPKQIINFKTTTVLKKEEEIDKFKVKTVI